eukprot:CAMPEP_0182459528 /NCGR_PEP_ID=MMETSP1319-20130603/4629_1 /TAXON_ID=172717 /ORGANISM="Bolidomonas pacifica, Strain RCC208" /LENGTH=398 /DNA_ID=CAMNT_0024658469 /DNA_START=129 /DNA_END=1321 /DNA_ORIENTATION=-
MSSTQIPSSSPLRDVLLGCTGSIAAVKLPALALALHDAGLTVTVVLTKAASYFVDESHPGSSVVYDPESHSRFMSLVSSSVIPLHRHSDDWSFGTMPPSGSFFQHPVLHVSLKNNHKLLLLAPLSANSLAKYSSGLADDTLSCAVRAWKVKDRPCVVAAAMNTDMWLHPATEEGLERMEGWFADFSQVKPKVKKLACGDVGVGAMADVGVIVDAVKGRLGGESKGQRLKRLLLKTAKDKYTEREAWRAAPISPASGEVVEAALSKVDEELGGEGVKEGEVVFDLGCGDGRWLKAAAELWGCKCVGLELDEGRVAACLDNVKGLANVEVRKESVLEPIRGIEEARVVVMYLFREAMVKMAEVFKGRQGLVLVCVGFGMPGWEAKWTGEEGGVKVYMYKT